MNVLGKLSLEVSLGNRSTTEEVIVCKNQTNMLLSCVACKRLGIIPEDFPKQISTNAISSGEAEVSKENLIDEFSDVFDTEIGLKTMNGDPMKIEMESNAVPFAIHAARAIPFAYREKVKEKLDQMEKDGIIKSMEEKASDWCHPMVVVGKKNGDVRICTDLTKLNKYVKRPVYPTKTPKEAVQNISTKARYFSVFDAKQGYWQMPLHEESQHLTAFLTPWGRYCYLRAPMGLSSTGDEYCRKGDEIISG